MIVASLLARNSAKLSTDLPR